ncbi:MAG TPA: PIN domain-containing protein [Thermoanaerobaculia bacterium]|nr:PIN domain-containing protein [Thermoanaerobaculia bacterium]
MTALGLDTSIVVRLLAGLPETQALRAKQRLEQALDEGQMVVVTDLVVAEAYHALHHHYGVPKREAVALLHRFVASGVVELEPASSVPVLGERGGAGFVDRLIHARHRALGALTLTFERRQSRLEGAERLAAD